MANDVISGGFAIEDIDNPNVVRAAKAALEAYNNKQHRPHEYYFWKVTQAESQLVAGTNYRIIFKALKSHPHGTDGWIALKCNALVFESFEDELLIRSVDCKTIFKNIT